MWFIWFVELFDTMRVRFWLWVVILKNYGSKYPILAIFGCLSDLHEFGIFQIRAEIVFPVNWKHCYGEVDFQSNFDFKVDFLVDFNPFFYLIHGVLTHFRPIDDSNDPHFILWKPYSRVDEVFNHFKNFEFDNLAIIRIGRPKISF